MTKQLKQIKATLNAQAQLVGAGLFGVTNTDELSQYKLSTGGELIQPPFQTLISVGMVIPSGFTNISYNNEQVIHTAFEHHLTSAIRPALDRVALLISLHLEKEGFMALPLAPSCGFSPDMIDHSLIATLAGLGWIGKNNRLVNANFGARIGLATILTNAELPVDSPLDEGCGQCCDCVELCPTEALSGVTFHPNHEPDVRVNFAACLNKRDSIIKCIRCLSSCPYSNPNSNAKN